MERLIQERLVVGPLQCNCVILGCPATREAVVIDPGDEGKKIVERLKRANLTVKYLLHTHAHFDHIGGTKEVKADTNGTVCLHKADDFIYKMLPIQGAMFGMRRFGMAPAVEKFVEDEEILAFGEHKIQVIHTPGHSPGGVCYKLLTDDEAVYTGDTLFNMSIGRTDLWGGDSDLLLKSIRERLFVLEDEITIHPGHGPSSQIGIEKHENPFLI
ncbi:MAG: MBL fold metallo-hydrolase [Deltaproteobacteria bacterium]|nr:MBL fold metallo-hydrolase [Deltaproteobacteria bacterium]MBI3295994.1 MBL fold metallo-hydrolase [Deltaproteobacteria bacterium]